MQKSLILGGALLALAILASAAEAGPPGGMSTSTSFSRGGDMRTSMSSSMGSAHNFGGGLRGGTPGTQSFNAAGLDLRGKANHWKKPNEPGQGEGDDPPKKPPKDPAGGSGSRPDYGWNYGHHGPGTGPGIYGAGGSGGMEPPLACRGRINGC